MRFKWYPAMAMSLIALAGCDADSNEPEQRDPFIIYTVNGTASPSQLTLTRQEDEAFAPCDQDLYANAEAVAAAVPEYCVTERSFVGVNLVIRFFNNSLEPLDLQFTGLGYRIQVFEYDENATDTIGEEVWNTDYVEQARLEGLRAQGETVADFDPGLAQLVTLGPAESYPLQTEPALTLFIGESNINAGFAGADFDVQGLLTNPSDGTGTPLCDWALVEDESDAAVYQRVLCRGESLLPLPSADDTRTQQFWIRTRFNFNDWQDQPGDVLLTIEPPA